MADDFLAKEAERLTKSGVKVLESALDKKHEYAVTCRYCKKSSRHPFPDIRAVTEALKFLNDYGKGRPAQQKAPVEEKKIESKKLEDLSDDELFTLLQSMEDPNGKTDGGSQKEAAS